MAIQLTSTAFSDGTMIPKRFTCDGEDLSPEGPFARKSARMKAVKRSVLPHLVNVEAAGMDLREVRARLARAPRAAIPPLRD